MLNWPFEMAAGSITGRSHVESGKNNQDAIEWKKTESSLVAVVCDGCSESQHSEVGAKLGSRLIVESLSRNVARFGNNKALEPQHFAQVLEQVRQDVSAQLRVLSLQMGDSLTDVVNSYFLFTVIGVLITQNNGCAIFSLGDGVFSLNGDLVRIGPFADNAPPYLGHNLIKLSDSNNKLWHFQLQRVIPSESVESILIGTDGVCELEEKADQKVPGKNDLVGPICQFWQEDRYFANPDAIRRRLTLVNRTTVRLDAENNSISKEVGLLTDDTSLIVVRRKDYGKVVRDEGCH